MLLATNDIGEGIIWKRKGKKYIIPEAEIIEFTEKDIISLSGLATTLYWGDDDNTEEDPTNGSNAATFVADFVANVDSSLLKEQTHYSRFRMILMLDQIKQNQTLSMIAVKLKPQQLVNLDYRCVRPAITIAM